MSNGENDTIPRLPRGLPAEIYHTILGYLVPSHDDAGHIDKAIAKRHFLSSESLEPPNPSRNLSARGAIENVRNFRLACHQFEEIGAPFLFTQVATRFSRKSLKRLEEIASSKVSRHVKRFTYLVPYFFEDGLNKLDEITDDLRSYGLQTYALTNLREDAEEQKFIINREEDLRVLTMAVDSFTSLQLIQLLRVTSIADRIVLDYLRDHPGARRSVSLSWATACRHASQTLGTALLASRNVQLNRFSLPMASPASAVFPLVSGSWKSPVSTLAERLTCLTLHFVESDDLDSKMEVMTELFKEVFTRAKKMKVIHIGFPQNRPLSLPLEDVFHNVIWPDLTAFGVQAWELDASEIVGLLRRHRKLRGLRLRDVHLTEGSKWKDVLKFVRSELQELQWISLRRIGYTAYYHSPLHTHDAGTEIPDMMSESEDEAELTDHAEDSPTDHEDVDDSEEGGDESDVESDVNSHEDSDDDQGPSANEMDFPTLNSPVVAAADPRCNCGSHGDLIAADELDDDEFRVDNWKRKRWESWVFRKCPVHEPR